MRGKSPYHFESSAFKPAAIISIRGTNNELILFSGFIIKTGTTKSIHNAMIYVFEVERLFTKTYMPIAMINIEPNSKNGVIIVVPPGLIKLKYCDPTVKKLSKIFGHFAAIPINLRNKLGARIRLIISGVVIIIAATEPIIIGNFGNCRIKYLRCGCNKIAIPSAMII